MNYNERKADSETIRPRPFSLDLSDRDMREFYLLAIRSGTTPKQILQGFICDLVDGSQTRGSDERELAQRYFSRCGYYHTADETFLFWASNEDEMEHLADLLQTMESAADDLDYYARHPEMADPGIIDDLKQEQQEARTEIEIIYEEYKADQEQKGQIPQSLEDGIEGIKMISTPTNIE